MLYHSTNNQSPKADFKEATIRGLAPDEGLYFPESIPSVGKDLIDNIEKYSNEEIALKVIQPFVGDTIPAAELKRIIEETLNFEFPLIKIEDNIFSLELYHGPTLAFKDVGARFMSRCLGHFVKDENKNVKVLVATSGDTGGAVANGFYNIDGIDVVILYPSGKVSSVQELQLTTLGKNITALEIDGSFDDCQKMVKQAFADKDLNEKLFLTSANSINVARWLPQQFYYFFAYKQWMQKDKFPVVSVPSGNFGNICAGLLAKCSGLPIEHFVAACNANNVVTEYLQTEKYIPKKSLTTISNAMDVGSPSNFVRILELFDQKFLSLKQNMSSYSFSDAETKTILKEIYLDKHYLLDPHGAVGYAGLKQYISEHKDAAGIFLETAHPVKFYDVVEPVISDKVPIPSTVQDILNLKKESVQMTANYEELKNFLLAR